MSEIVFVIGAGASKHCGTPLMNDFLDVARDLLRRGEVKEAKTVFEKVLNAVGGLNAVHSKAKLDMDNIESVYTAFEMGLLLGKLPGINSEEEIASLTPALRKVISYTLQKTTRIPLDSRFQGYYDFTNIINKLIEQKRTFTLITFNYDLGLDYTLYRNKILPDYGLDDIAIQENKVNKALYLKLHGSLNFGRCIKESCARIIPYREFLITKHTPGNNYSTLPIIEKLGNQKCPFCKEPQSEDPVIIPPTWNKTAYHNQIDKVWRRAAKEMADTEQIIIMGYSLPTTDWFFNYLYGLGIDMATPLKGFYVYNPDSNVEKRFKDLLGTGAIERFHYNQLRFEESISSISSVLGIKE
ncbi:MAG: hypothetical protein JXC36_08435 [Candidatus Atribacteria bacterium]|nr:hypothetical protein [Candidatus Atribacteria bacterium]